MADLPGLEQFSLVRRVVLITGSSSGLGLTMARGMAAAGATVGINSRDKARAQKVADGIPGAFAAAFDINDPGAVADGVAAVIGRHGRIDCLVNNAGVRDRRALADITSEDLRGLLETNLVAAYGLTRLVAQHMATRGSGRLIFVTSMVGPQVYRGSPSYVASKGGLTSLMRAMAVELGPSGITANAIAPGFFLTEINEGFFSQPTAQELGKRIPLRRWGKPEELIGAAIFLASDASSYVNGHVLTVDAGLSVAL